MPELILMIQVPLRRACIYSSASRHSNVTQYPITFIAFCV